MSRHQILVSRSISPNGQASAYAKSQIALHPWSRTRLLRQQLVQTSAFSQGHVSYSRSVSISILRPY